MFFGKKSDKRNPTREFQQPLEKQVSNHRGISPKAYEDSGDMTLDEFGMPPPPPSLSISSSEDAEENLIAANESVHETVEPELPSDYEERIEELDEEMHIIRPARSGPSEASNFSAAFSGARKVVLKDLSVKAIKKIEF